MPERPTAFARRILAFLMSGFHRPRFGAMRARQLRMAESPCPRPTNPYRPPRASNLASALVLLLMLLLPHRSASLVPTNLSTTYPCCQPLGSNMQLWWRLPPATSTGADISSSSSDMLDFALVGLVSSDSWMGWGPADPSAVNRLMGHADCIAAGIDESTSQPWAADLFLSGYTACDTSATPPDGVCPDSAFSSSSVSNVQLVAGSRDSGVTTLMLRRPLAASDALLDHAINVSTPQNYVWATGPLSSAPSSSKPAFRLAQHSSSADAYGTLSSFALTSCPPPSGCPSLATTPSDLSSSPSSSAAQIQGAPRSVVLAGGGARVSWTLIETGINLTFQAMQRSGYAALGVGTQMSGARAFVVWVDDSNGALRAGVYDMASYSASDVVISVDDGTARISDAAMLGGTISFSVTLALGNVDKLAFPLLWALGNSWSWTPAESNQHFSRSSVPTFINLLTGSAAAGAPPPPPPQLIAHALCMFIAFGVLVPALAFCARYLRSGGVLRSNTAWFQAHWMLAALAIIVAMAGGLTSALLLESQQRGTTSLTSTHSQLGVAALVLMCAQPLNSLLRPKPQPPSLRRKTWLWVHRISALAAAACGVAALVTGLQDSCTWGFGAPMCGNLQNGLITWFACLGAYVVVREVVAAAMAQQWLKQHGGSSLTCKDGRAAGGVPEHEAGLDLQPRGPCDTASTSGIADAEAGTETVTGTKSQSEPAGNASRVAEVQGFWAAVVLLLVSLLFTSLLAAGVLGGGAATEQEPQVQQSIAGATTTSQPRSMPQPPTSNPVLPQVAPPPQPLTNVSLFNCALTQKFELARLGDGWCDTLAPYNTAACGFDGGDCCDMSLPLFDCVDPSSQHVGKSSRKGLHFPAPLNPRYTSPGPGRQLSTSGLVQSYNNYYEFSYDKSVKQHVTAAAKQHLDLSSPNFPSWTIIVDGLVSHPMSLDVKDLINLFHIEQRIYRHRCVETWTIVAPWEGFPLRKLLALVQPLANATYVRFESDHGKYYPQVASSPSGLLGAAWPYIEGLTVGEAWNDLAFLSIGQYNATLPVQNGSPIRLTLPWKYGFKSIKAIRRISFTAQQPINWWQTIAPKEYGFYANINPKFPHPRWSQAQEGLLVSSSYPQATLPTLIYNGYGSEVDYLYGSSREFFY